MERKRRKLNKKLVFGLVASLCISIALNIYLAFQLNSLSSSGEQLENPNSPKTFTQHFEWIDLEVTLNFTETNETLTVTINVTGKNAPPTPSIGIAFDMNGDGQFTGYTYIFNSSNLWEYFSNPDLIICTRSDNETYQETFLHYFEDFECWSIAIAKIGSIKHPSIYCVQISETTCIYHIVAIPKPKTDLVFFETYFPSYFPSGSKRFEVPLFHYRGE